MRVYVHRRQDVVGSGVLGEELVGGIKAIDEERFTAFSLRMREEMEGLQPGRVGEVSGVCVGVKGDVGVCRVLGGEVGCEVVEAAVVGFADKGYAAEELLRRFGSCGNLVNVAESVATLVYISRTLLIVIR